MIDLIHPDDRVRGALWQGESLVDGAIYLFYTTSGVIVRRIRMTEETLLLIAENSDVPDLSFDAHSWTDRLCPVARILEVARSL